MNKDDCFEGSSWKDSTPEERFEAVLSSISDGVFAVDNHMRIACFNRAAQQITGYSKKEALGQVCHDVLKTNLCPDKCPMSYTLETGRPVAEKLATIKAKTGEVVPISISTALLRDKNGRVVGGVQTFRDRRLLETLRRQVEERYTFEDIVGKSAPMRRLFDLLPTVAIGESTVLIRGESGTGKELVANALHNLSDRKNKPFIPVNCGALPSELIESELFGYKAGAFTGASRDKPGRISRAEGGTLFLDEIGDLPMPMQVKLLRFLQEKTYEPLGGTTIETANVRIVSATNKDLAKMVAENKLREDLYYRLNVIELILPPLRDREGDLLLLAEVFLKRLSALRKKNVYGFSSEAMEALLSYSYPGNVRELENIIEHAFVLCPEGEIELKHLPGSVRSGQKIADSNKPATFRDSEKMFLTRILSEHSYNKNAVAKVLGIHKSTLNRKIQKLAIEIPPRPRASGKRN